MTKSYEMLYSIQDLERIDNSWNVVYPFYPRGH